MDTMRKLFVVLGGLMVVGFLGVEMGRESGTAGIVDAGTGYNIGGFSEDSAGKPATQPTPATPVEPWQGRAPQYGTDSLNEIRAGVDLTGCSKERDFVLTKDRPSLKLAPAKRDGAVAIIVGKEEFDVTTVARGGETKNLLSMGHRATPQVFEVNASGARLGDKENNRWLTYTAPGDSIPLGYVMGSVGGGEQKPIGVEGNKFPLTKGDVLTVEIHISSGGKILRGSLDGVVYICK